MVQSFWQGRGSSGPRVSLAGGRLKQMGQMEVRMARCMDWSGVRLFIQADPLRSDFRTSKKPSPCPLPEYRARVLKPFLRHTDLYYAFRILLCHGTRAKRANFKAMGSRQKV
jgi:hypothetical protein